MICYYSLTWAQAEPCRLHVRLFIKYASESNSRITQMSIKLRLVDSSVRRHLHKYHYALACLSHMSVSMKINAKHDHTALEKKEIRSFTPSPPPPSPRFQSQALPPFLIIPFLFPWYHPQLFREPHKHLPQHPFAVYFSSSPISSAIICLFHFSLAELIGRVCTVTSGPDIIAGQIARRLAADQARLSCAQTAVNWKA